MRTHIIIFATVLFTFTLAACSQTQSNDSKITNFVQLEALFEDPPSEYRTSPLWVWNDDVTKEKIDHQLTE
ncbi:MAG: hypothetical protein GF372_05120, partial [Candidatus Marinimicrobia bacterium]|nr:hypothetical protein [Candidatus Neomarinimicrobiota bacterium]